MPSLSCRVSGESIPQYAHAGDAGADITASEKIAIPPRERTLVSTGVRLEIPEGYVGLIGREVDSPLKKASIAEPGSSTPIIAAKLKSFYSIIPITSFKSIQGIELPKF